ncbi:exodeoxyribonuclease VII large subunit [Methylovirgula sp. HY1]|uniref:exodeoxyribonuclease VII large subunit n=1 Tax=Methylovirgula sp. HY1 TaxID=2822761 RepID=UPI001C5A700A|nr:exodeoxyribonuclease VII large subunit [Methylovirgula sp. HY1]
MSDASSTNAPEFTVSELSGALKRTIEDRFSLVRLRGEISNYRGPHSSGHAYFCLKDQGARIDAVIWKGNFTRLKAKLQEGLEVVATGKVTTFPGKSSYQLIVENLEPAGVGALMALLEERRRMLAAEGLFDDARKQLLPFLPETIGVVTSPTGAVIRDILHRISERFPRHVLVWPVRVQGESCAAEVAAAIEGFNALPEQGPLKRPDVIIIARGGGSLEDLWGFNEEIVVRAAAESLVPLISAIGHETDWTLLDHVADLRAPTPTAAAEKAVPVRAELAGTIADLGRRHMAASLRLLERRRAEFRALCRAMPQGEDMIALPRQRYDRATSALQSAKAKALDHRRLALAGLAHRLASQSPQAKMARAGQKLEGLAHRLSRGLHAAQAQRAQTLDHMGRRLGTAFAARRHLESERLTAAAHRLRTLDQRLTRAIDAQCALARNRLERLDQLLHTLGYRQVLSRGFALVRDAEGRPLRRAADVIAGAVLDIEFADGHRPAIATDQTPDSKPPRVAPRPRGPGAARKTDQGRLF